MSKALVMAAFLAVLSVGVHGQPPTEPSYTLAICESEFGNYTTEEYATNLVTVLKGLIDEANSTTMFFSTSAGTGPDKVFGQYYCRGDIPSSLCSECVGQAAVAALIECPKAKAVAVFFQECTLHYQNQTLAGVESITPRAALFTTSNVTDPTGFTAVANSTMTDLVMEAASEAGKFATGEAVVSATETVYCLVQCSPDLNATQCESCLKLAGLLTSTCCGNWPSALYVFMPSCQMMYNTLGVFYYTPNATSASSTSTPPKSLSSVRITRLP
ncbi:uncharacterized protein [Phyllobates terribilis]|uniref:uncharacterized protein n=1 Tax=Phyllobates terribilis TaxID=111132 RepID=UPI003CCAC50D